MSATPTLFDLDDFTKKGKDKISWSNSKAGTLESCLRKYYYSYYGNKKRTALKEPKKEKLQFLSQLSNRHLLLGVVVHDVIKLFFQKAKAGDKWDINKLLWLTEKKIKESFSYSIALRNGSATEQEYPPIVLKELYYTTHESKELFENINSKAKKCITTFFSSGVFQELRDEGIKSESLIEELTDFNLSESVSVSGKIDIAFYRNNGTFLVSDWKTGANDEDDVSLQLSVYALWATIGRKVSVNDIVLQKAFLNENQIENLKYSPVQLEKAWMRVLQSSQSMEVLDKYGASANEAAFTPCMQKKLCNLCPYEKICWKE